MLIRGMVSLTLLLLTFLPLPDPAAGAGAVRDHSRGERITGAML
jgi:hypothetical protein